MPHYVYIMRCADSSLYTGITNNLVARETRHKDGDGTKFTKFHGGGRIVYSELYATYLDARHREVQIKKWRREKKEHLIRGLKP
ncbi:MAG: GIY-YIG nuclease family protein [Candidatus Kerfeldbacteria bacterium]|nr:GIY-YIG nuclease family protein [Candidatus Kerfeldbacteria bacterium]